MKLAAAIDLGNACGLLSIEECVDNVLMHAPSLFLYSAMEDECAELEAEWKAHPDYPTVPRLLQECAKCGGTTWHRDNKCLRCERVFFDG
jgi:hypothetical protein